MKICSVFSSYNFSLSLLPDFNLQQKKILLVASMALSFLMVHYFIMRYCFKARFIHTDKQEGIGIKKCDSLTIKKLKKNPLSTKPLLLLHFDVNGTITLKDSTKKDRKENHFDYMLIFFLAKNTFAQWDAHSEQMSFKQYVDTILVPGDKSNLELKQKREKIITSFLDWLKEHDHPLASAVLSDYHKIKEKFLHSTTQKSEFAIFPSFYVMLDKLRAMEIPFKIILRSFGKDLQETVNELEQHPSGIKITHWAKFKADQFCIQNKQTINKVDEIFNAFVSLEGHFAVQDDWEKWHSDSERGRSGKIIPFVGEEIRTHHAVSGNDKEAVKQVKTAVFDDNITGQEQDIVCPFEISGNPISTASLCEKIIFPVNTKEAILNDNYYIERVLKAYDQ